ncbi:MULTISPECIES: DUF5988 family protein [Actinomadura]|uniref:Uncharacterized protein n=1 Tax=Actinomadura litoris TaxID=2678616 RepID=A0A7K1KX16_9ACTN|nr:MULTISPECIES: DUF5988 family protein [Actinomadura]MBT2210854.1 hypothetical protein [Actinomadura sp. NEAU-AAG7]MUN36748.1 hypothetical protein [Actinomadura litoris]
MDTARKSSGRPGSVCAVLEGGPADLPAELRVLRTPPEGATVKIPHRGAYQHFERADGPDGGASADGVPVYHWTTRTKIAE